MPDEIINIPLVWTEASEQTVMLANQFLGQHQPPGEFILSFGQVAPPIILGTDQEKMEQAQNLPFVPVKTVCRIAMNETRLRELQQVIDATLRQATGDNG